MHERPQPEHAMITTSKSPSLDLFSPSRFRMGKPARAPIRCSSSGAKSRHPQALHTPNQPLAVKNRRISAPFRRISLFFITRRAESRAKTGLHEEHTSYSLNG